MNIANKLTTLRLILIPIFVGAAMHFTLESPIPGIIFVVAAITDFFDGYLARSRNLVTTFGKFIDPLADKMLVAAALIMFVEQGIFPAWTVCIVIAREFLITGFRIIAASEGVTIAASKWGKSKTVSQFIAIVLVLFSTILDFIPWNLINVIYYVSVILTMISGFDYIAKNKEVLDLENI
ncbi:CDP-diacylglycerol--glycerol-3-phosphate 3-phosphatidyltransferase [Lagierella sp.]|uniref:CDP-diacylglycerol--glycerol-3-phosphate 3-phosphatidyltransferase n=1 Tax=Lagierella sp. TaxID=2849657 RepID=UPI002621FB54|nr:CDP-diacylglycerol--glycerol-3-phosphate 3-phosphatidyltransferase [Lagierella sp.]